MNPNDITANIYDIVSAPLKGKAITDAEISLMNFMAEPGAKVLDIGGGTGRHALPLASLGFDVTVIDTSKKMLESLEAKLQLGSGSIRSNIHIVNADVLTANFNPKSFDLVIMMWNSFNEIALTEEEALNLLRKSKEALKANGKILINIDDASKVHPEKFNFKTTFLQDGLTYNLHWTTSEYDKDTNTALSKEHIEIFRGENRVEEKTTFIKQRYWSLAQVKKLTSSLNLSLEPSQVKGSEELYLILT